MFESSSPLHSSIDLVRRSRVSSQILISSHRHHHHLQGRKEGRWYARVFRRPIPNPKRFCGEIGTIDLSFVLLENVALSTILVDGFCWKVLAFVVIFTTVGYPKRSRSVHSPSMGMTGVLSRIVTAMKVSSRNGRSNVRDWTDKGGAATNGS